jgi:hypothetical protein
MMGTDAALRLTLNVSTKHAILVKYSLFPVSFVFLKGFDQIYANSLFKVGKLICSLLMLEFHMSNPR